MLPERAVCASWGACMCWAEFSPTLGNLRKTCSSLLVIFLLLGCLWFLLICRCSVYILDLSLLLAIFAFNPWFAFLLSCFMVGVCIFYLGNLCLPQTHANFLLCYLLSVLLFLSFMFRIHVVLGADVYGWCDVEVQISFPYRYPALFLQKATFPQLHCNMAFDLHQVTAYVSVSWVCLSVLAPNTTAPCWCLVG